MRSPIIAAPVGADPPLIVRAHRDQGPQSALLRHTAATILLKAGVPVKVVSERLDHSRPAFTMTDYQHVLPGMQANLSRAFSDAVFGHD